LSSRLSIRARLTLLYTLSAFGMMAVVTGFQYWVLIRGLERDETQLILDKVQMLEATLRFHADDPAFLDHEVNLEGGEYQRTQYYVFYSRILDENGKVMVETPRMSNNVPVDVFPAPVRPEDAAGGGAIPYWDSPNGRSYFLMAVLARSGSDHGPERLIQVAMDDTGERTLIAEYRRDSLLALALGTLVFGAMGTVIARRGLRPLAALARVAERVNAASLTTKIDPGDARWPGELRALARAFYGMLQRLEDAFTRITQYSGDLAHELRTPIQNLIGEAEVALARERTPEQYQEILASSLEEYGRLVRLINELLFLARADDPQSEIERTEFIVRDEVEAVLDFHEAQAQEQAITIHTACGVQMVLSADRGLFRRALSNVVSNALRYTPAGGRVYVTAREDQQGGVEVAVRDTGCGIAAEDLPRVCDRFFRPNLSQGPRPGGAGLGLAIVKSIMMLHGGAVAVDSKVGRGTTVRLCFPDPGAVARAPVFG
jgi:two-component system heavy metal sensor histidine kinase CusS